MPSKRLTALVSLSLCILFVSKLTEGSVAMSKYGCPLKLPDNNITTKTGFVQLSGLNINVAERTLLLGPNLNTTVFRLSVCYIDDPNWEKAWNPGSYCLFSTNQGCYEGNFTLNITL